MRIIETRRLYIDTTKDERMIRVSLPEDYMTSNKNYSVLYMHDGQNLFDDQTAYSGTSWGIHETMAHLINKGFIDDLIIVGIDNSDKRLYEYSPWKSSKIAKTVFRSSVGGMGDVYAKFIIKKVKPLIDENFRTMPDYEHTMIAGSSMGAFISTYIAVKYPNVFQYVGIFSLASWFNENAFLKYLKKAELDTNQKFFISIGSRETSHEETSDFNELYLQNSRNLYKLLKEKNVKDILFIETDDIHHESAWKKVFVDFIRFANKKN